MTQAYYQLLNATIEHLEYLKSQGVHLVTLSPKSLERLNSIADRTPGRNPVAAPKQMPVSSTPASAPVEMPRGRTTSQAPEYLQPVEDSCASARSAPPADPQVKAAAFAELRQQALA